MDPQKINFLNGLSYGASVFDTSRNLIDKYFDIVWGCHLPGNPPKINFLNGLTWGASVF